MKNSFLILVNILLFASCGQEPAGEMENKIKVLLLFNKLSSYKKIIYYSIVETLGNQANVDLQIHHYNKSLFESLLERNLGEYHYYDTDDYGKLYAKIRGVNELGHLELLDTQNKLYCFDLKSLRFYF